MKVIKLNPTADAQLTSSTVAENDYPAWSSATTYALGARVIRASVHKIYESLVASNTNNVPEQTTIVQLPSAPKWLEVSATNRWKMFDAYANTQTSTATSMTVVLATSDINSFALFGLVGRSYSAQLRDAAAVLVYDTGTISLEAAIVGDWYDYFFAGFKQIDQVVKLDLPVYYAASLTVSLDGATVACGHLAVGYATEIGSAQYGAAAGITDYSKKEADAFGNVAFIVRAYSKRLSARLMLDNAIITAVQRLLASVRASPCVWVGTDPDAGPDPGRYDLLTVYGFFKDFSIEISYPQMSYCSLEIEGLI